MSDHNWKILLVEDDEVLGYLLQEYLNFKELSVSWVTTGEKALSVLSTEAFDLAILDVMMPDMDGFTLAEKIKQLHSGQPFLFLTAKSLKIDVLKGFSLGAVDYLKKPIDEEELVVRVNALLSRLESKEEKDESSVEYTIGKYTYDSANHELVIDSESWKLTTRENELLGYLARRQNQLCSHRDILTEIWGRNDYFNKKSLNVFVTRLRRYLEKDPEVGIENVHGKGFILRSP